MSAGPADCARATVERVSRSLEASGIGTRGAVLFPDGEGPILADRTSARSVLLLGNIGGSIWPAFSQWRNGYDGPDPLDTWSKSVILPIAEAVDATAYFPSDPPWQPFQRWAMRAEGLKPSPLGVLIHPQVGLWHGYRGALGFSYDVEPGKIFDHHPCDGCLDKPCLSTCPVQAVRLEAFDVSSCRDYLRSAGQMSCMLSGCHARNACPVGQDYRYSAEQLRFHMEMLRL
ncbi:4Fe-4S dicluster domain-containing protein [Neorhizobium lilium]|uniref:4Fe-4S dicluster domain-containing protein n=1 Tax=Neorhizobium lilium TaxID=2503024 RepID=A0A3S4UPV2_9HYPH|nr:4Fe-4S dicluster domain-containing protein [Neorhizobium lilium]RWX78377.1 4Fe-4S dicluster domain-containing protein [Neorhizobium lilium]